MRIKHLVPILLAALLLTACKIEPPVTVGQRDSAIGQGIVLAVTNTSEEHLHEVVVQIKSPEGETKTWTTPTMGPHETVNVGWLKLDGWPIPEGSKITVTCKDYMTSSGPWTV